VRHRLSCSPGVHRSTCFCTLCARHCCAGGKHFSLVVTAHWQGSAQNVQHFAYKSVDNNGVQFLRPDNALISKWKKGLQVGFKEARAQPSADDLA